MQESFNLSPDTDPLTANELKEAVGSQVFSFPQVVRSMADPPIQGQAYGNLSFIILDTPRIFRGKPIYGYVKLRGNHYDESSARHDAYRIVKEVDSKFQVRIAPVGTWVPITETDSVIKELYDVKDETQERGIRDESVKKKEEEARQISSQLREAEERLKTEKDIYEDKSTLDFYTMKRVTEMRLVEAVEIAQRKLEDLKNTCIETQIILKLLEKSNPKYTDEWVDNYNRERRKTSLPDYVPIEGQFDSFDNLDISTAETIYPEQYSKAVKKLEL